MADKDVQKDAINETKEVLPFSYDPSKGYIKDGWYTPYADQIYQSGAIFHKEPLQEALYVQPVLSFDPPPVYSSPHESMLELTHISTLPQENHSINDPEYEPYIKHEPSIRNEQFALELSSPEPLSRWQQLWHYRHYIFLGSFGSVVGVLFYQFIIVCLVFIKDVLWWLIKYLWWCLCSRDDADAAELPPQLHVEFQEFRTVITLENVQRQAKACLKTSAQKSVPIVRFCKWCIDLLGRCCGNLSRCCQYAIDFCSMPRVDQPAEQQADQPELLDDDLFQDQPAEQPDDQLVQQQLQNLLQQHLQRRLQQMAPEQPPANPVQQLPHRPPRHHAARSEQAASLRVPQRRPVLQSLQANEENKEQLSFGYDSDASVLGSNVDARSN